MIDGLPLHPLLVHAAVILLAVNGGALLACIAVPRFRRWLAWGLPLLGVATAVTAYITKETGENLLEDRVQVTEALTDHTHWGGWAGVIGIVLGITTVVYWLTQTPLALQRAPWLQHPVLRVVIIVACAGVAVAALALDFLAGHSGATSVWGLG